MAKKIGYIRPRSNPHVLSKLDRRSRQSRLMREVRTELTRHVGNPSPVEAQIIERCAILSLHVALYDAKALEAGELSEPDSRKYLAYSNALVRALTALGVKAAAAPRKTLLEKIHEDRAAREALAAGEPN